MQKLQSPSKGELPVAIAAAFEIIKNSKTNFLGLAKKYVRTNFVFRKKLVGRPAGAGFH